MSRVELQRFAAAKIGGESMVQASTSKQLVEVGTKAAGVTGSLLDSKHAGLGPARAITRVIRGATVTLYFLVRLLAADGLTRGIGLLVLATGGALVGIDLLTDATPAWLTAAGFGILLGGLAYAALRTRSLSHAIVLATPVVPLLVWSMTVTGSEEPSRTDRLTELVMIALLVAGLLVIGTVRQSSQQPLAVVGMAALSLLLLAVVAGLAYLAVWVLGRLGDWVGDNRPDDWVAGVVLGGGVAAICFGAALLATLLYSLRATTDSGHLRASASAHAAAFALVYGLGFTALFAWEATGFDGADEQSDWLTPLTWTTAAVLLLCVVLAAVPLPIRRQPKPPSRAGAAAQPQR